MAAFPVLPLRINDPHFAAGLVVGVSGGLDSVVLLDLLATRARRVSGAACRVAHVNYRLRAAADDDAAFVRALAQRYDVPCDVLLADPPPPTANVQVWARDTRYEHFQQMARTHRCRYVAVAHHADDQAETILWRLLRGTGLDGLAGMADERALGDDVTLLRPLLGCARATLEDYARARALTHRVDHTNATDHYTRNRIRHELLPVCESIQPGAARHVAGVARRLQPDLALLRQLAIRAWDALAPQIAPTQLTWPRHPFLAIDLALRTRIFRHAYHLLMGEAHQLVEDHLEKMEQIAQGEGTEYSLPGSCHFWCDGPYCHLAK